MAWCAKWCAGTSTRSNSSNEPGHASNKDTGRLVSFPYVREKGHPGQIGNKFEFIPNAPRDLTGNSPDRYRWVPKESLSYKVQIAKKLEYPDKLCLEKEYVYT